MFGLPDCTESIPYLDVEIAEGVWFPLHCPAWSAWDCYAFAMGGAVRGGNVVMGGVGGRLALPQYQEETDYNLDMLIVGECDRFGNPSAGSNMGAGLADNLETLRTSVTDPLAPPLVGRRWRLTMPNGTVTYATVQVTRFVKGAVVEGVDWNGYAGQAMTATIATRVPVWFA